MGRDLRRTSPAQKRTANSKTSNSTCTTGILIIFRNFDHRREGRVMSEVSALMTLCSLQSSARNLCLNLKESLERSMESDTDLTAQVLGERSEKISDVNCK